MYIPYFEVVVTKILLLQSSVTPDDPSIVVGVHWVKGEQGVPSLSSLALLVLFCLLVEILLFMDDEAAATSFFFPN